MSNWLRMMAFFIGLSSGFAFCVELEAFGIRNAENFVSATLQRGDSLYVFSMTGPRLFDQAGNRKPLHLDPAKPWSLSRAVSVAGLPGKPIWVLTKDHSAGTTRLLKWTPEDAAVEEIPFQSGAPRSFFPRAVLVDSSGSPWIIGDSRIARLWEGRWIWSTGPKDAAAAAMLDDHLLVGGIHGLTVGAIARPPIQQLSPVFGGSDGDLIGFDTILDPLSDTTIHSQESLGIQGGIYQITGGGRIVWLSSMQGSLEWSLTDGVQRRLPWSETDMAYAGFVAPGDTFWSARTRGVWYYDLARSSGWKPVLLPNTRQLNYFGNAVWASGDSGIRRRTPAGWINVDPLPVRAVPSTWDFLDPTSKGVFFHDMDLNTATPTHWTSGSGTFATARSGIRWRHDGTQWFWSMDGQAWTLVSGPGRPLLTWTSGPDTSVVIWDGSTYWISSPQGSKSFSSPVVGQSIVRILYAGNRLLVRLPASIWDCTDPDRPKLLREGLLGLSGDASGALSWTGDSLISLSSADRMMLPVPGREISSAARMNGVFVVGTRSGGLWIFSDGWRKWGTDAGMPEDAIRDVACTADDVCWALSSEHLVRLSGIRQPSSSVVKAGRRKILRKTPLQSHDVLGRIVRFPKQVH